MGVKVHVPVYCMGVKEHVSCVDVKVHVPVSIVWALRYACLLCGR